jgi:MFS family permease
VLLAIERRTHEPLVAFGLFAEGGFTPAVGAGSVAMSSILTVLLYYNLEAQHPTGLALSPVAAGLSILPLSAGLLALALLAPRLVGRFGPRGVLTAGMLLIATASLVIAVAVAGRMWLPLVVGLFGFGAGVALPYATAPTLALRTLPPGRAGTGSGIVNACTFLGGSIGVAAGAIAFAAGGLSAVMALVASFALVGAWLCRALPGRS